MNELIAELLVLFNTELVGTDYYFRSVHILDNFAMETLLRVQHFPALVITPINERHEQGPFADTAREIFAIRLRIAARSKDTYAYQVDAIEGTKHNRDVFTLSDKIRDVLYQNKRLVTNTFELRPKFNCTILNVLWTEQSGQFSARDIQIEYTRLELYTGMQNDQSSLDAPHLINF
jgi:hypothetical protein